MDAVMLGLLIPFAGTALGSAFVFFMMRQELAYSLSLTFSFKVFGYVFVPVFHEFFSCHFYIPVLRLRAFS